MTDRPHGTLGNGGRSCAMARPPTTRASAVRLQARKVRSLAIVNRASGSVPSLALGVALSLEVVVRSLSAVRSTSDESQSLVRGRRPPTWPCPRQPGRGVAQVGARELTPALSGERAA